ncbi:hypothetical protein QTP88_001029 [Uroleucon formosanum]
MPLFGSQCSYLSHRYQYGLYHYHGHHQCQDILECQLHFYTLKAKWSKKKENYQQLTVLYLIFLKGSLGLTKTEKSDDVSREKYHVENKNLIQAVEETNKREHFDARKNDIALFIKRDLLSDEEKNTVLTNLWLPNHNYVFPLNEKNKKRGLKFQHKWLNEFNWLVYSEVEGGAFCKHCVVFAKTGGIGNQPLKYLVTEVFDSWKKAKEVFRNHSALEYHTFSVLKSDEFLKIYLKKEPTIVERLDTDRIKQIKANRERLIPIVDCVILCGRQEIFLRGHKDYGKIDMKCSLNQGNFRAILKYRAYGDEMLKHIITIKDVNASKCFSVLVDETTDISTIEQMAMCVRYVDDNDCIHERFLKFITINSLTGCDLAESILNGLNSCEINLDYLYGQGYDGASNMSGHYKGVQAIIKKKYPKAIYVHCAAHSLNLAVSTASGIQPYYVFFNIPKRQNVLLTNIENSNEDPKRYDAVTDFIELFAFVVESLENISNWNDSTATEANILLKAIDSEFLISLQVIELVFSFGLPLCKLLQKEQIDLREAVSLAEDIINVLKNIRLNCDTEFHKLFLLAKEMSVTIDIDLSTKRISKRQVNRANPDPNLSVEEYHKVSVFIPYLDFFIQQLEERFSIHSEIFKGFQCLFSYTLTSNEEVLFRKLLEFYSPSLDVNNSIAELKLWKIKLERINNIPKTAIEVLHVCNANIYPNVHFILKILCTLPVSTSTPERMFSSLKRIKTYLRNGMSEKRLNGLAMLAIHNDITFSNEEVIDELAKKPRNLDIIL